MEYELEAAGSAVPRRNHRLMAGTAFIAVDIDQVLRTNDRVNVDVRPSFSGNPRSPVRDLVGAAAVEFFKTHEVKLKG
jgi:hypothetical protein